MRSDSRSAGVFVSQSGAMGVEEVILFDGRVGDLFTLSLNRTYRREPMRSGGRTGWMKLT